MKMFKESIKNYHFLQQKIQLCLALCLQSHLSTCVTLFFFAQKAKKEIDALTFLFIFRYFFNIFKHKITKK